MSNVGPIWHYTCGHGADGIRQSRLVRPNHHPLLGIGISWFTNLGRDNRFEAGLTSTHLTCDRMEIRFAVVDPSAVEWWPKAARRLGIPSWKRAELETGRLPAHWWVSLEPVEVAEVVIT